MPKINRLNGNVLAFAINALVNERTVFGSLTQSDTLDNNVNVSYLRGWGFLGPADYPTKQDFNAMGFTLGQLIAYLHQMGVPEWNTTQEYYKGSLAAKTGVIFLSLTDGNIGNNPDTSIANWVSLTRQPIAYPGVLLNVPITSGRYRIRTTEYLHLGGSVNIGAAPGPGLSRIDVITLDTSGVLNVVAGTAAATPIIPFINPDLHPVSLVRITNGETQLTQFNIISPVVSFSGASVLGDTFSGAMVFERPNLNDTFFDLVNNQNFDATTFGLRVRRSTNPAIQGPVFSPIEAGVLPGDRNFFYDITTRKWVFVGNVTVQDANGNRLPVISHFQTLVYSAGLVGLGTVLGDIAGFVSAALPVGNYLVLGTAYVQTSDTTDPTADNTVHLRYRIGATLVPAAGDIPIGMNTANDAILVGNDLLIPINFGFQNLVNGATFAPQLARDAATTTASFGTGIPHGSRFTILRLSE